ncbi:MAG TPA: NAD(P)H-binding protein [Acidimicrobiales bacterium]|nr:NAD(P)H-binding protein [Acidimicrobiales bacterium]
MARVLVTGGTGTLGRYLVPRLLAKGHEVRVLSRRPAPSLPAGATASRGDVLTGEGVAAAVSGTDAVVHAATSAQRRARATEVQGTTHVLGACRGAGAHLLYVSIVGVDRHRFPYYRAKRAAEELVQSSGVGWTIQRATQFHELLDLFLGFRVLPTTPNLAFQLVDAGEVSDRLVELVEKGPTALAPDFGGPEILPLREINATRRQETGKRAVLVPVPRVGFMRDFEEGRHHCPDRREGRITWREWLRSQAG